MVWQDHPGPGCCGAVPPPPVSCRQSGSWSLGRSPPHTPLLLTKCDWTGVKLPLFQRFHQSLSVCLLCSENEIVMMEYCANAQTPACRRHCRMQVYRAGCFPAHPSRLLLWRRNWEFWSLVLVVMAAKADSGWWGEGEDSREDWGSKGFENYGIEIQWNTWSLWERFGVQHLSPH